MILFNDLHITPDKKCLVIDVLILELEIYRNVYLSLIIINTQDVNKENYLFPCTDEDAKGCIKIITLDENTKHYRVFYPIDTIADNIFFVWVISCGEIDSSAECCLKKDNCILGVTYDKQPIYTSIMKQINKILDCDINKGLLDFMLVNKAFEINLKTGNYTKAIEYWKLLKPTNNIVTNKCGCYGTIR